METHEEKQTLLKKSNSSVKLKYVKLGYHYLVSNSIYLFLIPIIILLAHLSLDDLLRLFEQLDDELSHVSFTMSLLCTSLLISLLTLYFTSRPRPIYLVEFACYKPKAELMCSGETFMKQSKISNCFSQETMEFQKKILERSGYGQKTYVAKSLLMKNPNNGCVEDAREEVEKVMFGAIDELLAKTGVNVKDIGILVVNCSLFNPTPSLSSMVVNKYKLRGNIFSYNLGGMGCSAGLISIDLCKHLLQVYFLFLIRLHAACMSFTYY